MPKKVAHETNLVIAAEYSHSTHNLHSFFCRPPFRHTDEWCSGQSLGWGKGTRLLLTLLLTLSEKSPRYFLHKLEN